MLPVERIKSIFSSESGDVSALLGILSNQEKLKLQGYFIDSTQAMSEQDANDLQIKFLSLNSLFIYIKNNPSVDEELAESDIKTESIALYTYEAANALYQHQQSWLNYFYVNAYAVLADKVTYLEFQKDCQGLPNPSDFFERLLYFFIQLNVPISQKNELEERKDRLEQLKSELGSLHEQEQTDSQSSLVLIVAMSKLLALGEIIQEYLLDGTGQNVIPTIDSHANDAMKVFSHAGDREKELISCLLRLVLHKCVEHSVWTHANRFPFFKEFVNKQIDQGDILLSLFPSQRQAIQGILSPRKSTVISMPTSSGKTLLAELKILYTRNTYQNDCLCMYVVPTNALVNQTMKKLKNNLPELKIEQLLPYNHFDALEKEIVGKDVDVLVSTPEKLNFMLKNDETQMLNKLRLVIIDEAHNISDPTRGSIWEFLLASLKQDDSELSYLLLTPFIKNSGQIAEWLDSVDNIASVIEWSPTKQYVAYHWFDNAKTKSEIRYIPSARNSIIQEEVSIDLKINPQYIKDEMRQDQINNVVRNAILVEKYHKLDGCILILTNGPGSAEKLARELANKFTFALNDDVEYKVASLKAIIELEIGRDYDLLELLDNGIAFHHARLTPLIKEKIEELVADGGIKVLVATTTLAQGMNFPVKTVIFETLTLGGGATAHQLSNNEFWNIAGRAGRAYKHKEGHIIIGGVGKKNELEHFVKADIEETISSLKSFFDAINDSTHIGYDLIKESPVALNFLHYLNHLLNVSYNYDLDSVNRSDLINIFSNSLFFKQNEFSDGFLETQEKVVNFSSQYLDLIKTKDSRQLKLADVLGITDISLAKVMGLISDHRPKVSECIETSNAVELGFVIDAIDKIPELDISLGGPGGFDPVFIAEILLGWINGDTVKQISDSCELSINDCSKYLYSKLKTFMPWGIAIYQKISLDDNKLLPSFVYYGVNDEQSVKLSYLGVPRFALESVKDAINDANLYANMAQLRAFIKNENFTLNIDVPHSPIIRDIIMESVL